MNFLFGSHGERPDAAEVARSVHDADEHRRLAGLKAHHDPENVFRFHPSGAAAADRTPAVGTACPRLSRSPAVVTAVRGVAAHRSAVTTAHG